MVSIGSLRYDIVADVSGFTKGITATRRELTSARNLFLQTRTPAENLGLEMAGLDKLFKKGAVDIQTYNRAMKGMKSQALIAQGGIRGTVEQVKHMPGAMKTAVKGFVAYRAAGMAVGQIRSAFSIASAIESTTASFEVLTGSAAKAKGLVDQLRAYDVQTTFNFADTTQAAQKLLNFGVATEDVVDRLKALGDISTGDSEKLSRLALAFGQSTAMGKLMGQEVRQMVEAGFNPLQEIAAMTGESMSDLQERMKKGGISSDELADAIDHATSAGGRFFGMVEKRSKTMAGQFDLLTGEVDILKGELATLALPALKAGVSGARSVISGAKKGSGGLATWVERNFFAGNERRVGEKKSQQATAEQKAKDRAFELAAQKVVADKKLAEEKTVKTQSTFDNLKGMGGAAVSAMTDLGTESFRFLDILRKDLVRQTDLSGVFVETKKKDADKPQQVELPQSLQRGSVAEYQALAKIRSGQTPADKMRVKHHKESQDTRFAMQNGIDEASAWIKQLVDIQPEPVG